ncbi:MAG TPA: L,D-transpeptidase [Kofleriaceae bacterium]|nr:L,D-transpeptidase [Kofleriaceae bacterium]
MRRGLVLCLLAACSSSSEKPAPRRIDSARPPAGARAPQAAIAVPELPAYPPHVRSLRLRRSVSLRMEPAGESKRLGTVAQDTRVGYRGARVGPGCERRWIEIEPRGWVCETNLEATTRPTIGVELPKLELGERVPGLYGKLAKKAKIVTWKDGKLMGEQTLAGAATVKRYGETILRGVPHWNIGQDRYVAAKAVTPHEPSEWRGVRLGDDTGRGLPFGFALAPKAPLAAVQVWSDAAGTVKKKSLARRSVVELLETVEEGGAPVAYRIGEGEWLRASDVRVVRAAAPPPTTLPGERWFDIDLDQQTLVAYEGELPVYATLVSSGAKKTPSETGVFRIWVKFAETDMSGQMADEEAYSVATVPWTQYYAKDLALHTTYWHDKLGTARSHGCINLAPADARFLYFWSEPDVPPGWSMAHGVVERPGSMVRVKSAADPDPAFKGYATRVFEARRGASQVSGGSASVTP